jgi:FKBP-type peptidyl-prolyl cis-trans isomerase FkpA
MKKEGMKSVVFLVVLGFVFGLAGCLPDAEPLTPEKALADQLNIVNKIQLEKDLKAIDDTLSRRGITALKEVNGVRYVVETEGTGIKPTLSNKITAKYTGRILSSGATFAPTDTITINLYDLIIGWQTTVPLIPKGSKFTLYIPSGYGYGNVDVRNNTTNAIIIPKNSNLIFDIELLDVQ